MVDEKSMNAAVNESNGQIDSISKINDLNAQKKRLTELYINDLVSMEEYKRENERIKSEIAAIKGIVAPRTETTADVSAKAKESQESVREAAKESTDAQIQQKQEKKEQQKDVSLENLRIRYASHNRQKLKVYLMNKKIGIKYDDYEYFGYIRDEFSPKTSTQGDDGQTFPTDVNRCETANAAEQIAVTNTQSAPVSESNPTVVYEGASGAVMMPPVRKKLKRPPYRLACDIVAFVTMLLVILFTFTCYAKPRVEIGGEVYRERTVGIGRFSWIGSDSIRAQFGDEIRSIKDTIEKLEGSGATEEEAASVITGAVTKIVRLTFLGTPPIVVYISSFVYVVLGIIYLCLKRSKKLIGCCTGCIANVAFINAMFTFFGSISNGVGDSEYYIGYTVGFMARAVAVLGIFVLLTISVVSYIFSKNYKNDIERKNWGMMFVAAICAVLMIPLIASSRLYSVFSLFMTSLMTASAASLSGSFSLKSLLYPVLNFLVFTGFSSLYGEVLKIFNTATVYIAGCGDAKGEREPKLASLRKIAQRNKEKGIARDVMVAPIVSCSVAIVSIIALKIPAIGFGWSANLLVKAILLFFIASFGQTLVSVLATPVVRKKRKKKSVSPAECEDAAESGVKEKENTIGEVAVAVGDEAVDFGEQKPAEDSGEKTAVDSEEKPVEDTEQKPAEDGEEKNAVDSEEKAVMSAEEQEAEEALNNTTQTEETAS